VALELGLVGLVREVALSHPAHRGRKGRVREDLRGVCLIRGDRRGLGRDGSELLVGILVHEVYLCGVVFAFPEDRGGVSCIRIQTDNSRTQEPWFIRSTTNVC